MLCVISGLAGLLAPVGQAELLKNPDDNTLWIENGAGQLTGPGSSEQHWNEGGLEMNAMPGGGFQWAFVDKEKRYAIGRYLKVNPEYPYLTWEISEVERIGSYRDLTMTFGNKIIFSMVGQIFEGIYTLDVRKISPEKPFAPFFRVDLHGLRISLPYLKMVHQPDDFIEMSSPSIESKGRLDLGDSLTFRVMMKEPAKDVSLSFYHGHTMPGLTLNDSPTLQLKPQKSNPKIWEATVKISSCSKGNLQPGKPFGPGAFIVKAAILGGKMDKPLWTANACEFNLNPQ